MLLKPQVEFSVNYTWLCPQEDDDKDHATRLPLHYFERMYNNASLYPDAQFNLWIDFKQLSPHDRFFLDSHRYIFNANCIKLCNLRDIPQYSDTPGFDTDTNIALYARADYARVLVLNHLFDPKDNIITLYADLDCEDIYLNNPKLIETVQQYGIAFGESGKNPACNGYIAISGNKGSIFLKDHLLPKTKNAFEKNLVSHFGAFSKAITAFRKANYPGLHRQTWGVVPLPPMRRLIPYDPEVYSGVCAQKTERVPGSKELV